MNVTVSHTSFSETVKYLCRYSITSLVLLKSKLSTAFQSLFLWDGLRHKDSSANGSRKCSSPHRGLLDPFFGPWNIWRYALGQELTGALATDSLTPTSPELLKACLLRCGCSCNRSFPERRPLQQITARLSTT